MLPGRCTKEFTRSQNLGPGPGVASGEQRGGTRLLAQTKFYFFSLSGLRAFEEIFFFSSTPPPAPPRSPPLMEAVIYNPEGENGWRWTLKRSFKSGLKNSSGCPMGQNGTVGVLHTGG